MLPYRVYLSGGGICATAHVGALIELSNHIPLQAIKEWMGVSAGSLIAMCVCIGYTLDELLDFSVRFDFTEIKEMDSVPGWILHFGMDTGERLHRLVHACLHVKGLSSEFTFQECLTRFGTSLRIVATDINDACPIIFSPTTTPDYCMADAVRASMGAPYYFQPFICPVSNHYLVDGAVISNHPLFVLPDEEHSRTLSVLIRTSIEKKTHTTEMVLNEFMMRPLQIALAEKNKMESRFYDARCIQIMLGEVDILDFGMELDLKKVIIQKGKDAVRKFMGQYKPRRRNSI
jgi:predicted acylesterase/phospholipase RssA